MGPAPVALGAHAESRDATLRHIRHLWGYEVSLAGVDVETGTVRYECSTA